jgi:uncharacterized protein YcaQ
MTLSVDNLRRLAVERAFQETTGLGEAIAQMGFVQADPLRAPARAQDLIMRQRVPGYQAGDLERQYPDLGVDEDVLHVYGFVSPRVRDLLHPRLHAPPWDPEKDLDEVSRAVLGLARENGPIHPRDAEAALGKSSTVGPWGSTGRATTHALQRLHHHGLLRVARREKGVKIYETVPLAPNRVPDSERARQLLLTLARLYSPLPEPALKQLARMLRWGAPEAMRLAPIKALVDEGSVQTATVDGVRYLDTANFVQKSDSSPRVRLLAPFDPLTWDRARFEHLWGWPYRFEAYTPAAKRQFGHYALPLLWQDEVIGWANVTQTKGAINADLGFVRQPRRPKAFQRALDEELARLELFLSPPAQGKAPAVPPARPDETAP